mmetsp:Transcript_17442/g.42393  ORF Transcript_17442/g.42393 Transcript_17442/m.42393 type:complete len:98 (-) Transcript_17442:88-381(-)
MIRYEVPSVWNISCPPAAPSTESSSSNGGGGRTIYCSSSSSSSSDGCQTKNRNSCSNSHCSSRAGEDFLSLFRSHDRVSLNLFVLSSTQMQSNPASY